MSRSVQAILLIRIHSNSLSTQSLSSSVNIVGKQISFKNTGPAKHGSFIHL